MRLAFPLRLVILALLSLTIFATTACAAGFGLSWGNTCWGEDGSKSNLTWACNSNTSQNVRMTCSFKVDKDVPDFNGVGVFMEGMTEAATVPDWWKLSNDNASDCRYNLCTVSADGSVLANGGADVCIDPWAGTGGGGLGLYSWDTNRTHVNAAWASATEIPLSANTEYFAIQFRISGSKTVGGCAGCSVPMVWMLSKIDWTTPTTVNTLDCDYVGGNQCLRWQSSGLPCGTCHPDPVRNTTWGQIKSLYR